MYIRCASKLTLYMRIAMLVYEQPCVKVVWLYFQARLVINTDACNKYLWGKPVE